MKTPAAQANSGSVDTTSRGFINTEYQQLSTEINSIKATTTKFNGTNLIDGNYNQSFQVGISSSDTISANLATVNMQTSGTGFFCFQTQALLILP